MPGCTPAAPAIAPAARSQVPAAPARPQADDPPCHKNRGHAFAPCVRLNVTPETVPERMQLHHFDPCNTGTQLGGSMKICMTNLVTLGDAVDAGCALARVAACNPDAGTPLEPIWGMPRAEDRLREIVERSSGLVGKILPVGGRRVKH